MGLLESIKNSIIGEKIDKPFLEQPINKIDTTVPFGRVINTLSDDEPLRFQTFFDNVNDITYVDNLQKASEQAQKIDIYRQTAKIAECWSGLTEIVDEVAYCRDFKDPIKLEVDTSNKKIDVAISNAFEKIMKLFGTQKYLHSFIRQSYIDGQMNILIKYHDDKKKGIKELYYLDPRYLWYDLTDSKYKYIDINSSVALKNNFLGNQRYININGKAPVRIDKDALEYDIEEIVHQNFGLFSDSGICLSELEASVKTANQLKTLEDLLIPLRFSRSISRRVFNIDLSELPNSKAEAYMRDLTNKFKYKKQYNPETGEVTNNQHIVTMVEDYWIGNKAGAKGMQVDILDETGNLGELGDIMFFYKLLYKSMGIPINRIYLDEQSQQPLFDLQADAITNEDIKFFQKITRIRQVYTEFFMQILKRELICTKVCTEKQFQELKDSINIYFSEENQFIERMNLTLFMKRIDAFSTAKDFGGTVLPVDTLYKEIFRFNDIEIKKNLKAIQKESKNPLYKQFYRDFESGDEFSSGSGSDSDSDSGDEPKYDNANNNDNNTDTEEEYDKTGLSIKKDTLI